MTIIVIGIRGNIGSFGMTGMSVVMTMRAVFDITAISVSASGIGMVGIVITVVIGKSIVLIASGVPNVRMGIMGVIRVGSASACARVISVRC